MLEQTELRITVPYREARPRDEAMPVRIDARITGLSFALGQGVQVRSQGVDWTRKSIRARVLSVN